MMLGKSVVILVGKVLKCSKYPKKVEKFHAPTLSQVEYGAAYEKDAHGYSGNIDVGFPAYEFPQSGNRNASLAYLNFTHQQDLLNDSIRGYSTTPNNLNPNILRSADAYAGYIAPYVSHKISLSLLTILSPVFNSIPRMALTFSR
jgi:choline dehydrogenase